MKNKIILFFGILLLSLILSSLSFVSANNNFSLPKNTITIKSFFQDMQKNPQNYYAIINRSQEEVNYLIENTSIGDFIKIFNIPISNQFIDDGRNFLLIEIPTTTLGNLFGLQKSYSYVEAHQDAFLMDKDYEYYLTNNWRTFNYTIIYVYPQAVYYDLFGEDKFKKIEEKIRAIDLDGDRYLLPVEMVIYYLNNFLNHLSKIDSSLNTDYLVINEKNELVSLPYGERNFCFNYNSSENSIFYKYTYMLPSLNISESCVNLNTVSELYCSSSGAMEYVEIECPERYSCYNGACIPPHNQRNTIFVLILKFLSGNLSNFEIMQEILKWIF